MLIRACMLNRLNTVIENNIFSLMLFILEM